MRVSKGDRQKYKTMLVHRPRNQVFQGLLNSKCYRIKTKMKHLRFYNQITRELQKKTDLYRVVSEISEISFEKYGKMKMCKRFCRDSEGQNTYRQQRSRQRAGVKRKVILSLYYQMSIP